MRKKVGTTKGFNWNKTVCQKNQFRTVRKFKKTLYSVSTIIVATKKSEINCVSKL